MSIVNANEKGSKKEIQKAKRKLSWSPAGLNLRPRGVNSLSKTLVERFNHSTN